MAKKFTKALQATAYHEAGHAVAAVYYRTRLKRATIIPEGDTTGHCLQLPPSLRGIDIEPTLRLEGLARDRVMVSLAGRAAQLKFWSRGTRFYHARSDYERAVDLLGRFTRTTEELEAYMKLMVIRARYFIETWWPQISAVAEALLREKTLTGAQVKAITARTLPSRKRES